MKIKYRSLLKNSLNYFQNIDAKRKDLIAIIFICIFIFSFLGLSRTLTSGYHLQDDHEVIRIKNDLKTESIYNVSKKWITEDLNIRFRPMYFFHRVIETKVFGSNFILWSVYTGLLACLTWIVFYLAMRNFKYSVWESILFLVITFIGKQMPIWWRLGPNETIGVVFLGLAFFFMSKAIYEKHYKLNNILFCTFLIFSSLCKESFIIIIPGIILFKILNEQRQKEITLKRALTRNLILIVPLLVFIIEIYIIVYHVGTNKIGYAGLDSNFGNTFSGIVHIIRSFINRSLLWYLGIIAILTGYLTFRKKFDIKSLLLPFILFLLIIIPNLVLYAKSGLWERYLIPSSVGLAFFTISFVRAFGKKVVWLKRVLLVLMFLYFIPNFKDSFNKAVRFDREGEELKTLITKIDKYYNKKAPVLLVVDPASYYEQSYSFKTYLKFENKINVYGCAISMDYKDQFSKNLSKAWYSYFRGRSYNDLDSVPGEVIFLDKNLVTSYFKISKFDHVNYTNVMIQDSSYALLISSQ